MWVRYGTIDHMAHDRDQQDSGTSERSLIDANVDYGVLSGYFVRVEVEFPKHFGWGGSDGTPVSGMLCLEPDEAEDLALLLLQRAAAARAENGG